MQKVVMHLARRVGLLLLALLAGCGALDAGERWQRDLHDIAASVKAQHPQQEIYALVVSSVGSYEYAVDVSSAQPGSGERGYTSLGLSDAGAALKASRTDTSATRLPAALPALDPTRLTLAPHELRRIALKQLAPELSGDAVPAVNPDQLNVLLTLDQSQPLPPEVRAKTDLAWQASLYWEPTQELRQVWLEPTTGAVLLVE